MMNNTIAIVQARMGSSRLPGKVMKDIAGRPMLSYVVRRTQISSLVDEVVIATSELDQDDEIVKWCEENSIAYYRGSESDVLDRFHRTATEYSADFIVRVTADCPLISPAIIDRAIRKYHESGVDYIAFGETGLSDKLPFYPMPDGLDTEVFSFQALEKTWQNAETPDQREHVTLYMHESNNFELGNVGNVVDFSQYNFSKEHQFIRLTVDYPDDLTLIRKIVKKLTVNGEWDISQTAIYELFEREPSLLKINAHHISIDQ